MMRLVLKFVKFGRLWNSCPNLVTTVAMAVVKALKKVAVDRGMISSLELKTSGPVPSKPMFDLDDPKVLSAVVEAWDDATGFELPPDLVLAARKKEIGWCHEVKL